jgi:hypothetical protein
MLGRAALATNTAAFPFDSRATLALLSRGRLSFPRRTRLATHDQGMPDRVPEIRGDDDCHPLYLGRSPASGLGHDRGSEAEPRRLPEPAIQPRHRP